MLTNPELILKHTKPTEGFLCPVSANSYGIIFKSFSISDHETKTSLFSTEIDGRDKIEVDVDTSGSEEDMYRKIRYTFPEEVLKVPRMETSLTFQVGDRPLPSFRMIERHYFRDELIKSYDFKFGFVIPNSTNTWDSVYDIPPLPQSLTEAIIQNPYACKSDTFYYVGEEMVMHHKVSYKYTQNTGRTRDRTTTVNHGSSFQEAEAKEDFISSFAEAKISDSYQEDIESESKQVYDDGRNYAAERWSKDA